jgi:hypothetical protein
MHDDSWKRATDTTDFVELRCRWGWSPSREFQDALELRVARASGIM